jgi:hypothetical protein
MNQLTPPSEENLDTVNLLVETMCGFLKKSHENVLRDLVRASLALIYYHPQNRSIDPPLTDVELIEILKCFPHFREGTGNPALFNGYSHTQLLADIEHVKKTAGDYQLFYQRRPKEEEIKIEEMGAGEMGTGEKNTEKGKEKNTEKGKEKEVEKETEKEAEKEAEKEEKEKEAEKEEKEKEEKEKISDEKEDNSSLGHLPGHPITH